MKLVMALSTVSILALISILHIYWAYGGRWGIGAAIPSKAGEYKPAFKPGKSGTLFVAVFLLMVCFILLMQGGYIDQFPANPLSRSGCIVCASVFFLRAVGDFRHIGFFKKVKHTVFARNDTWLYSPLCLYVALTCTILLF
ncbi:DUF3995 domain-containing protein [Paenibacillus chitinolyticus]|uniref:DUF3995 domain-containing protein n=1 Tax=Paenibacillus chitinolyticus TaxID=79263 RepID=UPI001C442A43|nr:DUF3995 domain-containing protein [Paenibacillus chitinolyticus]MBV6716467.1 DUF3995 domain-containing protein [Paenibacillus chitinolyticus]